MVVQYPHNIVAHIPGVDTQDPETNDIIPGTPTTFESICRAEPNSEAKVIKGEDGQEIAYSLLVYLPKTDVNIPWGAKIEIELGASKTIGGKVLGHSNGQLNTRVWL